MLKKNIKNILDSLKQKKMRRIMRGYKCLKKQAETEQIGYIKRLIELSDLNFNAKNFSSLVYGCCNVEQAKISTKQYLLFRLAGVDFNKALLRAAGKSGSKVIYPLPKEWRIILESHGFKVSEILTPILWWVYVITLYCHGLFCIFKIMLSSNIFLKNKKNKSNLYAYFFDLSKNNFPSNAGNRTNIISWYMQWKGRGENIDQIRHSITGVQNVAYKNFKLVYQPNPSDIICEIQPLFRYLIWSIKAAILSFVDLFTGKWWHAFMLGQAAYRTKVQMNNDEALAREYFFHNSNWIYRPLWTYEAERRGSKIYFYFYSTNIEDFIWNGKKAPIHLGFRSMTWPNYLVWDKRQRDFIIEATGVHPNIIIVGEIWFLETKDLDARLPSKSVAIFDITPKRESRYCVLAPDVDYYTYKIASTFLSDIYEVASKMGLTIALKSKRDMGNMEHPRYKTYLRKLKILPRFMEIKHDVDPNAIIENSVAVISAPFTSTAILGMLNGKPSAFYDPTGLLVQNDPAAHGITILKGKKDLASWLDNVNQHLSRASID